MGDVEVYDPYQPKTSAEKRLLAEIGNGEIVRFSPDGSPPPAVAADDVSLSGPFLKSVITRANSGEFGPLFRGVLIQGAYISGVLNLDQLRIREWLALLHCNFEKLLSLQDSVTRTIWLSGSLLPRGLRDISINGAGAQIEGDFDASFCQVSGRVSFSGASFRRNISFDYAKIAHTIDVADARFNSFSGRGLKLGALEAEGCAGSSGFYLGSGAEVEARVNLKKARIDGKVTLGGVFGRVDEQEEGAKKNQPRGREAMKGRAPRKPVFLYREINLSDAKMDMGFEFERGSEIFVCINAIHAHIASSCTLSEVSVSPQNSYSSHAVMFAGAKIFGNLSFEGANISRVSGSALHCDGIYVEGAVFLRDGFRAESSVRFIGGKIDGELYCGGSYFEGGPAFSAARAIVQGAAEFDRGCVVNGGLFLDGANLGSLKVASCRLHSNEGTAISIGDSVVKGEFQFVAARSLKTFFGTLNVGLITHDVDPTEAAEFVLTCLEACGQPLTFWNRSFGISPLARRASRYVLQAVREHPDKVLPDDIKVGLLEFAANLCVIEYRRTGMVAIPQPNLATRADLIAFISKCDQGNIGPSKSFVTGDVNFQGAQVGVYYDSSESWPENGVMHLEGFTYERLSSFAPKSFRERRRFFECANRYKLESKKSGRDGVLARITDFLVPFRRLYFRARRFFDSDEGGVTLQPYELMSEKLADLGAHESARRVAKMGQDQFREYGGVSIWFRPLHWLFGLTTGYGYRLNRAAATFAIFTLLGWWIYGVAWSYGAVMPAKEIVLVSDNWRQCLLERNRAEGQTPTQCWLSQEPGRDHEAFHAGLYAFDVFLPILSLEQEEHWTPAVTRGPELREMSGGAWLEDAAETFRGTGLGDWFAGWARMRYGELAWGYRFFHEMLGYVLSAFVLAGLTNWANRTFRAK